MSSDRCPERVPAAETSLRRLESSNADLAFWTWEKQAVRAYKTGLEGRNAREHGPLIFRAMQGQSDAVRASMMKHMILLKPQLFSEEVKRDVRRLRYSFRLYD